MSVNAESSENFKLSDLFNTQYLPQPGDALLILHASQEQMLARCWPAAFMLRHKETSRLVYRGTTFIAPPSEVWVHDADATFELLLQGLPLDPEEQMGPAQQKALRAMFTFVRCSDLESRSLVNAFDEAPAEQFVFVPDVSLYSNPDAPSTGERGAALKLEEDTWVRATVATAQQLIVLAKQKSRFLLLTSPADPPIKPVNINLIGDVEHLSMASFRIANEESFLPRVQKMVALSKTGRAAEALDQLDAEALPALMKLQARIQIVHHSGDSEGAAKLIRELLEQTTVPASSASRLAAICHQGDDLPTAKRLIDGALGEISQEESLSACLQIATSMRDADLVERGWTRFKTLFPANRDLQYDCEIRMLQICRQNAYEVKASPIARTGFTEVHTLLAERLAPETDIDYQVLLEEVRTQWPQHHDLAAMCAATHAEVSGDPQAAWGLAGLLIPGTRFAPAAAKLIVRTIRALFLVEAASREQLGVYVEPLKLLVEHLGQHPGDKEIRALLRRTLSVEFAGREGLALIAAVAAEFADNMPEPIAEESGVDVATDEEFQNFQQRWKEWAKQQVMVDPRVPLPAGVVGADAVGLARLIRNFIEHGVVEYDQADDLEDLSFQAHILAPLARHIPSTYDDLQALRALSVKFSLMNNHQRARDLAELILEIAGDQPGRRRLAWSAYADIYQRAHDATDALLAIACAGATRARLPASNLYHETYTHLRTLRDMGLHDAAEVLLEKCSSFFGKLGMTEAMQHRLEVVGLTLQMSRGANMEVAALQTFQENCQRVFLDAVRLGDELFAAAYLFVQALGLYERAGGQLTVEAAAAKQQALTAIGPEAALTLQAISAKRPTAAQLVDLHNRTARARYASDAPTDAYATNLVAPRLLAPADPEVTVQDACLAIELLADRGLTLEAPPAPLTVDGPIRFARSLAQEHQVSVLMLAHDSAGELVATIVEPDGAEVQRAPRSSTTARDRLRAWSQTYPFRYGLIDPRKRVDVDGNGSRFRSVGDGEFYESMRPFTIPLPQGTRVLIVAEPEVAQVAFNLVVRPDGDLIGYDTAIGMVPSLTWLEAIRQRTRTDGDRRVAWLSDAGDPAELDAMSVVRGMLEAHLDSYRITLDTSRDLPQGLEGAQMAIVTTHGQLARGERYFRRIVDEGALKESPLALAQALARVELVILFVCSGGRMDRHPSASTTVGLPKMLLEQGCRTVIASPWPLESLAAGPWLEGFLAHWEQGATAMDACHEANKRMAARREREPQFSLAMTVYGDPLLVRPPGT
ncbi:CHAT domain-containing protein [Acidovorax sp. NCPPB 4044]|uniref:CHAT domain-containing protein n=1 Tax=Acidovorax sp. NCPPB 4044 TaxID=2940490 RepID=UPI0023034E0E|nr:CHAT domain-containing protein [Acidovorax sp. NCPPB 4044]MDA8520486.1 CHAT domain-containing protein [Acidovorax sp. NCPPB 4044]